MSQSREELVADARAALREASRAVESDGEPYDGAISRAGIADVLGSLADQELRLRLGALAAAAQARTPTSTTGSVYRWDGDDIVAVAVRFERYLRSGE